MAIGIVENGAYILFEDRTDRPILGIDHRQGAQPGIVPEGLDRRAQRLVGPYPRLGAAGLAIARQIVGNFGIW